MKYTAWTMSSDANGVEVALSDWPPSERPREKLLRNGARILTDGEILAVLLGHGTAKEDALELSHRLLRTCGDLTRVLTASPTSLARSPGLGPAGIARIKAALEVGRRHLEAPAQQRDALNAPDDAVRFFRARLADLPHEVFSCLFLDTRHRLIRYEELFRGTVDGAAVYPREVLKRALHHNAAAVIFGHNHPSGISEPSEADRGITLKLGRALALVDVRLLDHLVVTRDGHVSLAERGWI